MEQWLPFRVLVVFMNARKNYLHRLQTKWDVKSFSQIILILLTFTLTGTTVVYLRKWLFATLGFTTDTSIWLKTLTYILFVFPAYQLLILIYGSLLGQRNFFWAKEKKLFNFLKSIIFGNKNS
jgi:hypothetical protein